MLCRDVKRAVYFFLDGSLSEKANREYNQHLNLCADCDSRTKLHKRFRTFLHDRFNRLSSTTAPERLKLRLARSIRAFKTEWSR